MKHYLVWLVLIVAFLATLTAAFLGAVLRYPPARRRLKIAALNATALFVGGTRGAVARANQETAANAQPSARPVVLAPLTSAQVLPDSVTLSELAAQYNALQADLAALAAAFAIPATMKHL